MLTTIDDVHLQFAQSFKDEKLVPFLYLLSKKMSEGHVCLAVNNLSVAEKELPEFISTSLPATALRSSPWVGHSEQDYRPFIFYKNHFYLHRYFHYETQILNHILRLLEAEKIYQPIRQLQLENLRPYLHQLLNNGTHRANHSEKVAWPIAAVIQAVEHQFSIITGGPGTGKTTSVRNVLAVLFQINPKLKVALAAPTGKAAMRMAESLKNNPIFHDPATSQLIQQLVPTTLHRLLGYKKNSLYFKHDQDHPLPYDVLIVDECSMIDVSLFAKMMCAVASHTQLILLGDKNQLASVEAGSLFGDLCETQEELNQFDEATTAFINSFIENETEHIPTLHPPPLAAPNPLFGHVIELRRSHRFRDDEGIGQLSKAVIQSDVDLLQNIMAQQQQQLFFIADKNAKEFSRFLSGYQNYIEEKDPKAALKKLNRLRILCAVRQGKYGLYQINQQIETYLQQQKLIKTGTPFYEHRPILISENRYDLGLFNGDSGIVRRHPETGELMAFFETDGNEMWVLPAFLPEVETAFALTIHKSQGSEFDEVLVILPELESETFMTRELLYTAITRAKKKVIILGTEEQIVHIASQQVERTSGIATRFFSPQYPAQ